MDSHAKTETLLDEEFQRLPGVLQVNPDENVESLVDTQRNDRLLQPFWSTLHGLWFRGRVPSRSIIFFINMQRGQ